MTGHTTGPHTHFELSYNNQKINPRPFLPEIRNYPKEEDFTTYNSATPSAITIPAAQSAAQLPSFDQTNPESDPELDTKNQPKLTAGQITEQNLTTMLSANQTTNPLPLNLLPKFNPLPETSDLEKTNSGLINSLAFATRPAVQPSTHNPNLGTTPRNNLHEVLSITNPQLTPSRPLPEGGRVSFNLNSFLQLK